MSSAGIIALVQMLVGAVPRLIKAWKAAREAGNNPGNIKLSDFVSQDALDDVEAANDRADDYING